VVVVPRIGIVPPPTLRRSHALGGPAPPSRHVSVASSVTTPLAMTSRSHRGSSFLCSFLCDNSCNRGSYRGPDDFAKSSGHGHSGNRSPSPQGAKGKEAMELDGNDLGHLSYGLELDDIDDDLLHSTIVRDDHDLVLEDDRMQEDSPYSPAIELVPATPDKTPASLTLADKPVRKRVRKTKKSSERRSREAKHEGMRAIASKRHGESNRAHKNQTEIW